MGLKLDRVIPWGRSMEEYVRMFNLTPRDLQLKILDCAGGPASFNTTMTRQGYSVISCDPVYQFTACEINRRIQEVYPVVIGGVQADQSSFVWRDIKSPAQLGQVRMAAMDQFLEDFPQGLQEGRYVAAELPTLPFSQDQFDLALCSHFLFTYSEQLSEVFHLDAIAELCRVAAEVRIFPLLNLAGEISPHLQPVISALNRQGYQSEIERVDYEFQPGGNQFLRVYLSKEN
jgi:hypothetical protein